MINFLFLLIVLKILGKQGVMLEPLLKHTINATIIKGGIKSNVIPHEINLEFDVRILPGFKPEDFLTELLGLLDTDAEFTILGADPMGPAEPDMGLYPLLASILEDARAGGSSTPFVLQAVTDARFFNALGIQT